MIRRMPIVPRHEPEVVRAETERRWRGDPEKVATTSLRSLLVEGVLLQSRYAKADEYQTMACMVLDLPPEMAARVHSIFCDSKSGTHSVSIPDWDEDLARAIGRAMGESCKGAVGGHAGIRLSHASELLGGTGARTVEIHGSWADDIEE